MNPPSQRLAKPLYESLPALYVAGGIAALALSYLRASGLLSGLLAIAGIAGLVGGAAIWLRRRDYRRLRADYPGDSDGF